MSSENSSPCSICDIVVAQDDTEALLCIGHITVKDAEMVQLDLCVAPPPNNTQRSGIYPRWDGCAAEARAGHT